MTKKLTLIVLLLGIVSHAQDFKDALLFSTEDLQGTPRFTAMGGAFGAVGGDLSALKINPAGSAVFATNQMSFTLDFNTTQNNNTFLSNKTETNFSDIDISQAGAVFVFVAEQNEPLVKKISFGINYDRINNLNDELFAFGQNNTTIANYFVEQANGIPLDNLTPFPNESFFDRYDSIGNEYGLAGQEAYLAYEAFVINSTNPNDLATSTYAPNVFSNNYSQAYTYDIDGNSGKITFNSAVDLGNKLLLGLNINAYFVDFTRFTRFNERNSAATGVNLIEFDNILNTRGNGISFDFGAIYKPTDEIRLGLSYKTPTWMRLQEELSQVVRTDGQANGVVIANPEIFNIYPDYKFRTPATLTGSLAVILQKNLLLSADVTRRNYADMKFRSSGFQAANNEISSLMKTATEVNLGGEYRIKDLSLRAGYNYHESPFAEELLATNIERLSVGLGYAFGNTRLDLSYVNSQQDRQQQTIRTGLNAPINVNSNQHFISLGMSYAF